VWSFIPDLIEQTRNTSAAEGVAVAARGNVYGAEVGPRSLKQYVRNQETAVSAAVSPSDRLLPRARS